MHTMQSVSKTVTSITIGIAMGRKEFPADLDAPVLKYFDDYRIANLDERKQRITLRNLVFDWSQVELSNTRDLGNVFSPAVFRARAGEKTFPIAMDI